MNTVLEKQQPLEQVNKARQHHSGRPEMMFSLLLACIAFYLGGSGLVISGNHEALLRLLPPVALFGIMSVVATRIKHDVLAGVFRCTVFLVLISFLYTTLAELAFNHVPWNSDRLLFSIDEALGLSDLHTVHAPELMTNTWLTEVLAFSYSAFIPYLVISFFLYGASKSTRKREIFLTAFAVMYAIGFLGYLFVPAAGPVVHLSQANLEPIAGGFFHSLVTNSVNNAGGPHGAFPSIHMSAAALVCLFDFRHGSKQRAFLYLPLLILIAFATVLLRYHYMVDLLAGLALAAIALIVVEIWFSKGAVTQQHENPNPMKKIANEG